MMEVKGLNKDEVIDCIHRYWMEVISDMPDGISNHEYNEILKHNKTLCTKIRELPVTDAVTEIVEKIRGTEWYHLFNGELRHGASTEDEALYKATDILAVIDDYSEDDDEDWDDYPEAMWVADADDGDDDFELGECIY